MTITFRYKMGRLGKLRTFKIIRQHNKYSMTGKFAICKYCKTVFLIMAFESLALLFVSIVDFKKHAVLIAIFTGKLVSCLFLGLEPG
jgi:hypothetical protein